MAIRVVAKELQNVSPCVYRVAVAADLHIDWRQNFPATAVVGIACEVRLNLRNQVLDRILLVGRGRALRARRLGGKSG